MVADTGPADTDDIGRVVAPLVEPALTRLASQLASVPELSATEQAAVVTGTGAALRTVVWQAVNRLVLLELHAARLTGTLRGDDPAARWRGWVDRLSKPEAWRSFVDHYPPLLERLETVVSNRCAAALRLAHRFSRDRRDLAALVGTDVGELHAVEPGAGDSHQGGQSVTIVHTDVGPLVYKPRSVEVDRALAGLLAAVLPDSPTRIRVPAVLARRDSSGAYGWAEHVAHRHCADEAELSTFYRNLGHWLAVMRLLGGGDLHAENLIAAGPVPVVVDCETLFTPHPAGQASGYGGAVDLAADRIGQSVLRTGLLPGRATVPGMRGVDVSGAGFLPGQQPALHAPTIVDFGTDHARMGTTTVVPSGGTHLPTVAPELGRYWERVVDGFTELTGRLRALDAAGALEPLLAPFADCPVRVVVRATAVYAALARMLWHPSSLHQPQQAYDRARRLLLGQAQHSPVPPGDPAVVEAELADLLDGDIPVFHTTPATGELRGPRGTRWGAPEDLVRSALRRWRETDAATERRVVQAALLAAYLNDEGDTVALRPRVTGPVRRDDLERRRRTQAAAAVRRIVATAVRAADGTATWIAPTRHPEGWVVRPLSVDLYNGGTGVAVLLAAYLREVEAGRADPVTGVAELLAEVLQTQRLADDKDDEHRTRARAEGILPRPDTPGGFLGLGSRIWGWLLLHRLGAVGADEAVRRAERLAAQVPESVAADAAYDLLVGAAGAVVPLLRLAEWTGRAEWVGTARGVGRRLREVARWSDEGAWWSARSFPDGVGGLSHGVTGIGWALARLAAATGETGFAELAEAAFAWEEARYDPREGAWRDVRSRGTPRFPAAWCHGAVGIGLAAADLLAYGHHRQADVLRRAAEHTHRVGFTINHTLCHGTTSAWEVVDRAWAAGVGPTGTDRDAVLSQVLTVLEDNGPVVGLHPEVLPPGMFPGLAGIGYQLLRMHPDSDLPSLLLPDPGPPPAMVATATRGRSTVPSAG